MNQYKQIVDDLMKDGNWFRFPKRFLTVMKEPEAVFLSFLINHNTRNKKIGEWFYCTVEKMEKELYSPKRRQSAILSSLASKGFISVKRKGIPSIRWIKINLTKIWEATIAANPSTGVRIVPTVRDKISPALIVKRST